MVKASAKILIKIKCHNVKAQECYDNGKSAMKEWREMENHEHGSWRYRFRLQPTPADHIAVSYTHLDVYKRQL